MPRRPPVHRTPGWRPPIERCAEARRARDRGRGSAASRGYDATWRRLRLVHLAGEPWCRMCAEAGLVTAAEVVDHIVAIEEAPDRRLDATNLRSLCKRCHDSHTARTRAFGRRAAHPEWLRPSLVPLVIVCGAPGSGKSHWVAAQAGRRDLVVDLDVIGAELSGQSLHDWDRRWLDAALDRRNALLDRLGRDPVWPRAWLIVAEPKAERRAWWERTLRPETVVVMETAPELCITRIARRLAQPNKRELMRHLIGSWWQAYQRRDGEQVIVQRGRG